MIHLRSVEFNCPDGVLHYPFNVPAVQGLRALSFEAPVTIFVGENGSGKSTVLEALAAAAGTIAIGSADLEKDDSLAAVKPLADKMKLVWRKRTHRGFFLRAEDFFGYTRRLRQLRQYMKDEINRIDQTYTDRSEYAKTLAKGPALGSLHALDSRYGEGFETLSHGEGFLALFQSRFVPKGLYLLDEPEAALSPVGQIGLLALLKTMIDAEAQFIIATHAPILMAFPGAQILDFDQKPPASTPYDDLAHVTLYRSFLENPEAFIRRI